MIFNIQPVRYHLWSVKVSYACSYLHGEAFLWVQPYLNLEKKPDFLKHFSDFCIELERIFGDPNKHDTIDR